MANKLYEYMSPEQSGVQIMESSDGKDLFMAGLFIQGDVKNQNGIHKKLMGNKDIQ